jgi:hypothetical protein
MNVTHAWKRKKARYYYILRIPPEWVNIFVKSLQNKQVHSVRSLDTAEEVRKTYEILKQQAETLKNVVNPDKHHSPKQLKNLHCRKPSI